MTLSDCFGKSAGVVAITLCWTRISSTRTTHPCHPRQGESPEGGQGTAVRVRHFGSMVSRAPAKMRRPWPVERHAGDGVSGTLFFRCAPVSPREHRFHGLLGPCWILWPTRGHTKNPASLTRCGMMFNLATSYFRIAFRHTIIGATAFHFRVRNGNGWYHCAMVTRLRLICG